MSKQKNPVAEARELLGGTFEDVAVICRVSRQAVWLWEKAGRIPDSRCAVLVAEATGIPVARLAGLGDTKPGNGKPSRKLHTAPSDLSEAVPAGGGMGLHVLRAPVPEYNPTVAWMLALGLIRASSSVTQTPAAPADTEHALDLAA